MEYAVETNCLTKKFHHHVAVSQINMHVKRGEIYGFIGRNGAGKTTCMKMLCGLSTQTDEEIRLFGKQGAETKAYMERIGNLIENPGLYPNMTGYENLKCKCIAMGIYKKGYIEEILKQVGLENDRKKKVKNYSLGMKQRLGIGMALVGEPDLLILDEPINGLDPQGIAEIRDTLKRLNQKKGITILISSHILEELYKVADTFGIINQGELILELSKEELEKRCSDYIEIQTEDAQKTCTVLEILGIHEYKVTENHVIHIYEALEKAAWLNTELVKQGCLKHNSHFVL